MGEIILTMPGPWSKRPALTTDFELSLEPADDELVDDFRALGGGILSKTELSAIAAHQSVLCAAIEVAAGDRSAAAAGVRLAQAAFAAGALGLYVETGAKVYGADGVRGVDPDDITTLFHFYVEFVGDPAEITSEGMQAFGLPDVATPYYDVETRAAASGAVFSLAAQMVVDGLKVGHGDGFRASESARTYVVQYERLPPSEEDFVNPHGRLVLLERPD